MSEVVKRSIFGAAILALTLLLLVTAVSGSSTAKVAYELSYSPRATQELFGTPDFASKAKEFGVVDIQKAAGKLQLVGEIRQIEHRAHHMVFKGDVHVKVGAAKYVVKLDGGYATLETRTLKSGRTIVSGTLYGQTKTRIGEASVGIVLNYDPAANVGHATVTMGAMGDDTAFVFGEWFLTEAESAELISK